MKQFIVLSAIIAVVAAGAKLNPEIQEHLKQCKINTGVSEAIATKLIEHDFTFDDDQPGKCFAKCLAEVLKITDSATHQLGTTFFEERTTVNKEKLQAARDLCNGITGADDCDSVYRRLQCLFKEVPEIPVDY